MNDVENLGQVFACWCDFKNADSILCQEARNSQKVYPGYDTKLHLIVKLQFWGV